VEKRYRYIVKGKTAIILPNTYSSKVDLINELSKELLELGCVVDSLRVGYVTRGIKHHDKFFVEGYLPQTITKEVTGWIHTDNTECIW
jgi:hypothetical protein